MVVNYLEAHEQFNHDFIFKAEILSENSQIPLDDLIGKMACIECMRHDGSSRFFNGYVFSFKFIKNDAGYSRYEMILRPWLAFLTYRNDCQVFQEMSLKQRSLQLFKNCHFSDVLWHLRQPDPEATFSVQFNETDYNYLQRQWEKAGWIYWYEHRADGHTLHIIDQTQTCQGIKSPNNELVWRGSDSHNNLVGITSTASQSQMTFNHYSSSTFDFKSPDQLQSEFKPTTAFANKMNLESYVYDGAYAFKDAEQGNKNLKQKSDAIAAEAKMHYLGCNNAYAEIGHWFKLTRADSSTDVPAEYLITSLSHKVGNNYLYEIETRTAQYEAEIECLDRNLAWIPKLNSNSEAVLIYGLQTAKVVGPPGEEIYTDKYGCVKVQFHWDRLGQQNENSSAWVRVATAWAGSNFGMVSIPRIGQEVIVQFLDGNPDRPVITGSVYNEDNLPPWELPANATQSGILSRSTVGATTENANAIRFEDKKGAEEVWIQAEKDQNINVKNNETHTIGVDRTKSIGSNETVSIGADRTETVGNNETITIGTDRTETVGSNETINIGANRTKTVTGNENITIQQNRTKSVVGNETDSISKNQNISVTQNQSTSVGQNQTVTVGLNKIESVAIAKALNVGAAYAVTVGAGHAVTVAGAMNTAVGLAQFEQVGLAKNISVGKTFTIDVADKFELRVGASTLVLKSDGSITISGKEILIDGSGPVQINGKDIDLN
ncbi:type VI secretion system tip protein VgrG [Acinetobacter lanii]|uniref:Type VI secretion system tip protein VgrG n=2 Tax=Acinetobacter lanii TaxID=2715163 RepID=A0A6G8S8B8_9GAMM|nr:type VI secretion system tip protein VgrG [Acinetobacter lanii]